ncbi:MAG: citrate synthase [Planctomycetota bacterium]
MGQTAKLTVGENEYELPVVTGVENESALDIAALRRASGLVTLDEGYVNTGSTTSDITFLNGEEGVLRYRGYPIEKLAANCDFLEVAYLLIYGDLPTQEQMVAFKQDIRREMMLHEDMRLFYDGFPRDAHPMAILSSVVGALSTFYSGGTSLTDPHQINTDVLRLIAKLPTIAAYAHKKSLGQPFIYPETKYGYCENFLRMMFASPIEPYQADPDFVKALNLLLIVHADHEQNCSTSTVRMVGSSDANLFSSISAGISALWGPLHGGANEACVNMLERIVADGGDVNKYVDMAKDKANNFRLMGFGHRVYKNFDPRADIIKASCEKLLAKRGIDDPMFDVAKQLADVALSDEYFIERKLYPNVDFYSGVIYRAIGIPKAMFTAMFAIGRLPGWIAHWLEMRRSPGKRICRPRQIYTGPGEREFMPLDRRI